MAQDHDRNRRAETALAEEVASLRLEHVPSDVVEAAVDAVIDTVAVAIAARGEELVELVRLEPGATGSCTRLGDGGTTDRRSAAFANGVAAHVLDFDDWLPAAGLHPSAPLLPAVLAQAQHAASSAGCEPRLPSRGAEMLVAFIAGFEAQARIGHTLAPTHYEAGFHPTATIGIFGAAAGAARLQNADSGEILRAWGLAATQASGIRAVFGTMGKSFQVGRAAEAGVITAGLAAAGATAPQDAVLGERGFAASHGHLIDPAPAEVPFAERWYLRESLVKRHAACFGTHAAIDALLTLRKEVDPAQIAVIELSVPELLSTVCAIPDPVTPLEAKFSLAFTAALALTRGTCQIEDFSPETLSDPHIRELLGRVRLRFDGGLSSQCARVRVVLDDGTTLQHDRDSSVPMPPEERSVVVRKKLRSATSAIGADTGDLLLASLEGLKMGNNDAQLLEMLGGTLRPQV